MSKQKPFSLPELEYSPLDNLPLSPLNLAGQSITVNDLIIIGNPAEEHLKIISGDNAGVYQIRARLVESKERRITEEGHTRHAEGEKLGG